MVMGLRVMGARKREGRLSNRQTQGSNGQVAEKASGGNSVMARVLRGRGNPSIRHQGRDLGHLPGGSSGASACRLEG